MRTAAQLDRVPTRNQHPNHIAILVAEERNRTLLCGFVHRHLDMGRHGIAENIRVDQIFDGLDLLRRHPLEVAEIETKPIGTNQRPLLLHMVAKDGAKGAMKQVRPCVVATDSSTTLNVDRGNDVVADRQDRVCVLACAGCRPGTP